MAKPSKVNLSKMCAILAQPSTEDAISAVNAAVRIAKSLRGLMTMTKVTAVMKLDMDYIKEAK